MATLFPPAVTGDSVTFAGSTMAPAGRNGKIGLAAFQIAQDLKQAEALRLAGRVADLGALGDQCIPEPCGLAIRCLDNGRQPIPARWRWRKRSRSGTGLAVPSLSASPGRDQLGYRGSDVRVQVLPDQPDAAATGALLTGLHEGDLQRRLDLAFRVATPAESAVPTSSSRAARRNACRTGSPMPLGLFRQSWGQAGPSNGMRPLACKERAGCRMPWLIWHESFCKITY